MLQALDLVDYDLDVMDEITGTGDAQVDQWLCYKSTTRSTTQNRLSSKNNLHKLVDLALTYVINQQYQNREEL